MDYKKLYKQFIPIEWDTKKYEIHHIDGNRKNNSFTNLVLLPKELHKQLHKSYMKIHCDESNNILKLNDFSFICFAENIDTFLKLKMKVFNYIQLQNFFYMCGYNTDLYKKELEKLNKKMGVSE